MDTEELIKTTDISLIGSVNLKVLIIVPLLSADTMPHYAVL
jgi:hypothetical protein